ncbi:2-amino-4-hydroxy-6-hydroxymethyldihydropteridine diphosphokinase [Verrucomicrobiota bacterium]
MNPQIHADLSAVASKARRLDPRPKSCDGAGRSTEIGLSLGSNLGERLANLKLAKSKIAALPGTQIAAVSPVYETEPVNVQPEFSEEYFLNSVLIVESELDLHELSSLLHAIEKDLGRARNADNRNAPRIIDIDIIYAGRISIKDKKIEIPHPRWKERRFVVQPLADIRPDLQVPGDDCTVNEVLLSLPPNPKVTIFVQDW